MTTVITRGTPNFMHIQTHEVDDLDAFVATHELRIRRPAVTVHTQYTQPGSNKPVMLYIAGIEENRELIERRCLLPGGGSMRLLALTITAENTVRSSGTASQPEFGRGIWYMLEPHRDPRYPQLWEQFVAKERELARLARIEEEREEALKEELDNLASGMGYEEAIRRLKGD